MATVARRNIVAIGTILFGLAAVAVAVFASRSSRTTIATTTSRLPTLKRLVEQQEKDSAKAAAWYVPTSPARLDDLTVPAEGILRQLPSVVCVEVAIRADQPTHRIVQLRDWHFVPKDLFALDVGRELSGQEIDRLHEEHCLEVEAVQLEQLALLRCLIKHHGLRRIYCEGLTEKELADYRERAAVLRSMELKGGGTELPCLRS